MEEARLFSKKTITLLEANGYYVKTKGPIVSFRHSSGDRIGLVVIGSLLLFASFILLVISSVPIWIASASLLIIGLVLFARRMADKDLLMFDLKDKTFFHKRNGSSIWLPLNNISEIILKSRAIGGSILEPSDEDHHITISLLLESNKKMVLFKFLSEFQQPSIQIKEVYNWIESTVKGTNI